MRLAKSVPLLFMLTLGALPVEMLAPASVGAGDVLEGTIWNTADDLMEFRFLKGGAVEFLDVFEDEWIKGTYRVSASSVTMSLAGGHRIAGTIAGSKMKIQITWASGKVEKEDLIKNVAPPR